MHDPSAVGRKPFVVCESLCTDDPAERAKLIVVADGDDEIAI
jgi:hypothetical protein